MWTYSFGNFGREEQDATWYLIPSGFFVFSLEQGPNGLGDPPFKKPLQLFQLHLFFVIDALCF